MWFFFTIFYIIRSFSLPFKWFIGSIGLRKNLFLWLFGPIFHIIRCLFLPLVCWGFSSSIENILNFIWWISFTIISLGCLYFGCEYQRFIVFLIKNNSLCFISRNFFFHLNTFLHLIFVIKMFFLILSINYSVGASNHVLLIETINKF